MGNEREIENNPFNLQEFICTKQKMAIEMLDRSSMLSGVSLKQKSIAVFHSFGSRPRTVRRYGLSSSTRPSATLTSRTIHTAGSYAKDDLRICYQQLREIATGMATAWRRWASELLQGYPSQFDCSMAIRSLLKRLDYCLGWVVGVGRQRQLAELSRQPPTHRQ